MSGSHQICKITGGSSYLKMFNGPCLVGGRNTTLLNDVTVEILWPPNGFDTNFEKTRGKP